MSRKQTVTLQSYPRETGGQLLSAASLFPRKKQPMDEAIIAQAVDDAFSRCIKNKKGLTKKVSKTPKPDGRICLIINGDSREKLSTFENSIDLIVTSPPYADARKKHYDSIHPNDFPDWLATFHDVFWSALKPDGSLVINIKDKIVDGVRSHFVWKTIEKLEAKGWHCKISYERVLKEKPAKKYRIVYEEQSVDFIDKKYATLSSQMSLDLHERHSVFTSNSVLKQSNR